MEGGGELGNLSLQLNLTPEQREKLRALFAARWQRGPQGPRPGAGRGMAPQDGTNEPAASAEGDGGAAN